ncbi:MAG: hypothetical protein JXA90_10605 [Planctomycetes bacterium]|nr:hypothetical protein [Planctomycetota bacterium]
MRSHRSIWTTTRESEACRENGLSLVEVAMAVTLFALISVSVSMTLAKGIQHRQQSFQRYQAMSALRDLLAEVQETANQPQDLTLQQGIGAIYARYHGQAVAVPEIPGGQISVTCHGDETAVPAVLGGPQDLNFDGDALDNLANQSNGTDLKLVPMTLTVQFGEGVEAQSLTVHRLVCQTSD